MYFILADKYFLVQLLFITEVTKQNAQNPLFYIGPSISLFTVSGLFSSLMMGKIVKKVKFRTCIQHGGVMGT